MADCTIPVPSRDIPSGAQAEGCAFVRFSSSQEVYCQPVAAPTAEESETRWLGRFREVSREGLSLVLRRRFEPGTALTIELSDKPRRGVRSFPVQVVHATPEGKSRWIIGCEFLRPLSDEELQTLGEF
jgi:hypothetical protein